MAASINTQSVTAATLLQKAGVPGSLDLSLESPRRGYPPGQRRPVQPSNPVLRI